MPVSIRSSYNYCNCMYSRIIYLIFFYKIIKAALIFIVCEFNIGYIEGNCIQFHSFFSYIYKRNKKELGFTINKTFYEPGTSYPVNFWPLTGDPFHKNDFYKITYSVSA